MKEVIAGGHHRRRRRRRGCVRKLKHNIFIHCVLDLHSWRKDLRENGGSYSLRGIEEVNGEESSFPTLFLFVSEGFCFNTHYNTYSQGKTMYFVLIFLDRLQ